MASETNVALGAWESSLEITHVPIRAAWPWLHTMYMLVFKHPLL